MSNIITIKTGTSAPTSGVLAIGELGFDTVAGKVYIGTGPGVPIELGPGSSPDDYIGATSETIGVHGLVPSATSSEKDNFLRGDGTWSKVNLPSDYVGATAGAAGVHGLVPAAQTSQSTYFLRGNGSWTAVTPSLIGAASAIHASQHGTGGADPTAWMWNKTLTAAGWIDGVQDISLAVTSANVVLITGATDADKTAFANAQISVSHIIGGLRFTAITVPSVAIELNIAAV